MNFVRNARGISRRRYEDSRGIVKFRQIRKVSGDSYCRPRQARQLCNPFRLIDACDSERNVVSERCLNLWKDFFKKPDHRIPVGTGFFMDCSNEQESAALI